MDAQMNLIFQIVIGVTSGIILGNLFIKFWRQLLVVIILMFAGLIIALLTFIYGPIGYSLSFPVIVFLLVSTKPRLLRALYTPNSFENSLQEK